ncbi:MAG: ribosomal protein S18-alanine N-acetyltransferase [Thermoplasmata archaeon]|nr:MAG: ribosomal protein S18-alanine N-acetyltransferase [Thermoplasmata archaeon]
MAIERQCFPHPWSENMFEALYMIEPNGFHVALLQDNLVGYALTLIDQGFGHGEKRSAAHLLNIAVQPKHQRKGIGTELVNAIIPSAKNAGMGRIYLEVRISNDVAKAFYTKLGFSVVSQIRGFYENEDALVMIKELS